MSPMLPNTLLPRGPGGTRAARVVSPGIMGIAVLSYGSLLLPPGTSDVVATTGISSREPSLTCRRFPEPQARLGRLHRLFHHPHQFLVQVSDEAGELRGWVVGRTPRGTRGGVRLGGLYDTRRPRATRRY